MRKLTGNLIGSRMTFCTGARVTSFGAFWVWRRTKRKLSRYLSAHIALRRLCETDKKDSVLPQLKLFFKGKNAFRFSRLWEKVYQYAVVVGDHEFIRAFYESVNSEIGRIEVPRASGGTDDDLTGELREDLETYNKISLGLCVALLDMDLFSGEREEKPTLAEKTNRCFQIS